jgi:hypothetical protein
MKVNFPQCGGISKILKKTLTFTAEKYIFVQNSKQGEFIYLRTRSEEKRTKAGNPVPVESIPRSLAPLSGNSFRVMTCSNLSKAHDLRSESIYFITYNYRR